MVAGTVEGGTIPKPENFVNSGDPWLAADRYGVMYYSKLTFGGEVGNLEVGVAKSSDGGRTWSEPTFASPHRDDTFYLGDKNALTVGPDPGSKGTDVLYDTWDDVSCDRGCPESRGTSVAAGCSGGYFVIIALRCDRRVGVSLEGGS